jgi:hypothetical protein
MKKTAIYLSLFVFTLFSCSPDDFIAPGEGFSIQIGNQVVIKANDIDYYDLSTHFIYLKGTNSFITDKLVRDSFHVYVNAEKVYSGVFHAGYMSSMPLGPAIYTPPMYYGNYIVPITFNWHFDSSGKKIPSVDPRSNSRVLRALKSYGQLHEGLKCTIRSAQFDAGTGKASILLELKNADTFDYYHLDPEKMGLGLFHYFTNGLWLWNLSTQESYGNHLQHVQPTPWNSWKPEWLSLIRSGETKLIRIDYPNFDPVPAGNYLLYFRFPGLSNVEKSKLQLETGRIWLGELDLSQNFQVR